MSSALAVCRWLQAEMTDAAHSAHWAVSSRSLSSDHVAAVVAVVAVASVSVASVVVVVAAADNSPGPACSAGSVGSAGLSIRLVGCPTLPFSLPLRWRSRRSAAGGCAC